VYPSLANSPLVSQITFKSNRETRMTTTKSYDFLNRLRSASYSANSKNQYTSRGVPPYIEVLCIAKVNATVTVEGSSSGVYRRGEYFRKELYVNNANAAQYPTIDVDTDVTSPVSGEKFLPLHPESFSHDTDGNLTGDGRWTYTWDAENRLIKQERNVASPSGARQKLEFEFDWQGRRIRKQFFTHNGSSWVEQRDTLYLYDGWNLIAELNANSSNVKVRTYIWGLDLSGSMQGAGGVGGLLMVIDHTGSTRRHYAAYDGNGSPREINALTRQRHSRIHGDAHPKPGFTNLSHGEIVMGLADSTSGKWSARYEYGPFGEPIRANGDLAYANPMRWSTKYTDGESGLVYYGYRYYNPSTGRWLRRDPIEELGGSNLHCFAQNDPQKFVDPYGLRFLSWVSIIRNLPVPPDLIERVYAWLMARLVDNQYLKVTKTEDVACPKGASRHLLSETDDYVEERNEVSLNIVDYDLLSSRVYTPKKHIVTRTYGCCNNCWGFDTRSWNNDPKQEHFSDLGSEGFDFGIVSGEAAVKKHSIFKKRWRNCKQSVTPTRSWTNISFPDILK